MSPSATVCPACHESVVPRTPEGSESASCPRCGHSWLLQAPALAAGREPGRVKPARPVRRALVAVVAVAALAAAGVVIVRAVREELDRGPQAVWAALGVAQAQAPAGGNAAPASQPVDPSANRFALRSPLAIVRVGAGVQSRPVVMLGNPTAPDFEDDGKPYSHGILVRELIRQAVLLAARDELGAATRDEVLGESLAGAPDHPKLEVTSLFHAEGKCETTIRRLGETNKKTPLLFDHALDKASIPNLVNSAEELSRTKLPGVLKKLGLTGTPNPWRPAAALPAGIDEKLTHMGDSELFAAVRALHGALRTDGESPARLAALARAYALLGVLNEFHWHPAHKAFKARALLYAQRLCARTPDDPFALWNRAFVRALVGMHFGAEADLNRAGAQAKAQTKAGAAPPAPEWVPLIAAYVRYDVKNLESESDALAPLAGLLHLLATEFPWTRSLTMPQAQKVLRHDPDCFRAIDMMCQVGGISDLHVATELGPQILDRVLPAKLRVLDALPAGVGQAIDGRRGEPVLLEALRAAGAPAADVGEPSWGVVAHLIAQTRFVHVYRRLWFMRNQWSVPVGEYWAESHLLVAGHPYRPFLESLALPPQEAGEVLTEFLAKLDLADIENTERLMTYELSKLPGPRASHPWHAGVAHRDRLAQDLAACVYHFNKNSVAFAERLLAVSPHSPIGRAAMIEKNWEWAGPRLAEWEKDPALSDSPVLLGALAKRYTALKRFDDARQALERYIQHAPVLWAYQMLARNYADRGDMAGYKRVLDDFLARGEDGGLDKATIRVEIAHHLMGLGRFEQAQPYAEQAAQTWAGWAMECAGQCNEELGELERAEHWFRGEAERYPRSFMQWYLFCKRTGYGDANAAAQLAQAYVQESAGQLSENEQGLAIVLYESANLPQEGLTFIKPLLETPSRQPGQMFGRFPRWLEILFAASFADAAGDSKFRDACLTELAESDVPAVAQAIPMFRAVVDPAGSKPIDRQAFDKLIASADELAQNYLTYFAGRFLERHAKPEDAAPYLYKYALLTLSSSTVPVSALFTSAFRNLLYGPIPDEPWLWLHRARYHKNQDREDLALADLNKLIAIDPRNPNAYNLRAIIKRHLDDLDGAAADFGKLIEIAPADPLGPIGRGVTAILQGRDADAEQDIERGEAVAPKSGFARVARGLLFLAHGAPDAAEQRFDEALTLDPKLAPTIYKLKHAVLKKRHPQPARPAPPPRDRRAAPLP